VNWLIAVTDCKNVDHFALGDSSRDTAYAQ